MSLARAFTQHFRADRSSKIKHSQISLPIQLTHTTNDALSHKSPDLVTLRQRGYCSTLDTPLYSRMNSPEPSSPMTLSDESPHLTDASSFDSSMVSGEKPLMQQYFPSVAASIHEDSPDVVIQTEDTVDFLPPLLPKRAPSHSKREHERLARKRSVRSSEHTSNVTEQPATIFESAEATKDSDDPFAPELAQLDAVQEDYRVAAQKIEYDEDTVYLMMKGLAKYDAADYLFELETLREAFGLVAA